MYLDIKGDSSPVDSELKRVRERVKQYLPNWTQLATGSKERLWKGTHKFTSIAGTKTIRLQNLQHWNLNRRSSYREETGLKILKRSHRTWKKATQWATNKGTFPVHASTALNTNKYSMWSRSSFPRNQMWSKSPNTLMWRGRARCLGAFTVLKCIYRNEATKITFRS